MPELMRQARINQRHSVNELDPNLWLEGSVQKVTSEARILFIAQSSMFLLGH